MQNRGRGGEGDARELTSAGLALLWSGELDQSLPLFNQARTMAASDELPHDDRIDVLLALVEAAYLLGEPEGRFETLEAVALMAAEVGDLLRQARALALLRLFAAYFAPSQYPTFEAKTSEVLLRAVCLNDSIVSGFDALARGRSCLSKGNEESQAVAALDDAVRCFREAARAPWSVLSAIERSKALLDAHRVADADEQLDAIFSEVRKYPILAVWFGEARGQWNAACGHAEHARVNFETALQAAIDMGLDRRADVLRKYLLVDSRVDALRKYLK